MQDKINQAGFLDMQKLTEEINKYKNEIETLTNELNKKKEKRNHWKKIKIKKLKNMWKKLKN